MIFICVFLSQFELHVRLYTPLIFSTRTEPDRVALQGDSGCETQKLPWTVTHELTVEAKNGLTWLKVYTLEG